MSKQTPASSRNLLEIIIEQLPTRLFWKDKDSRYLGCNTAVAQDARFGSPGDLIGKTDFISLGKTGRAVSHRRSGRDRLRRSQAWLPEQRTLQDGTLSVAAIPFLFTPVGLGVLVVYGRMAHAFNDDIVALLVELTGNLAYGIDNLRLRAAHLGIFEKLEHSLDNTVAAIASTVEMRDPYTAGHQRRVAKLASSIGEEMGLSHDQMHTKPCTLP